MKPGRPRKVRRVGRPGRIIAPFPWIRERDMVYPAGRQHEVYSIREPTAEERIRFQKEGILPEYVREMMRRMGDYAKRQTRDLFRRERAKDRRRKRGENVTQQTRMR